jgi:hypothetical protein
MAMSKTRVANGGPAGAVRVAAPLVVLLTLAAAGAVHAADPPHWYSDSLVIGCTEQCHTSHQALGGGLNPQTGNANLCQTCHNASGWAADLPIGAADMADPGSKGTSHAFEVDPVHLGLDTQAPNDGEMSLRLMDGNVVCSTCHDQHDSQKAMGGRSRVGAAQRSNDAGGTGSVVSGGTYTGDGGVWYLIEIDGQGSQSNATFRWSKDNGTSWMAETVGAGDGSPVALDFGVTVTLTGAAQGFKVGDSWEFSAAWPFLRRELPLTHPASPLVDAGDISTGDAFCRDCHRNWVMTHDGDLVGGGGVRGWDGNYKSHPVGVGLDANSKGYDRAAPLDGHGVAQDTGDDGNPTNDLELDQFGNVQCLSCHGVHYTDSNTQTVDRQ